MSIDGIPLILFQVIGVREWYEDNTISVTKTGNINTIISTGTGSLQPDKIIVKIDGTTDTTSDV